MKLNLIQIALSGGVVLLLLGQRANAQTGVESTPPSAAGAAEGWTPKRDAAPELTGAQAEQGDKPVVHEWTLGVSEADQRLATRYFKIGNALLKSNRFHAARHEYVHALEHWDHPTIHYNYALATIPLGQTLEVYEELVKGLRYGTASFSDDPDEAAKMFATAQRHHKQARDSLVELELSCESEGAVVSIDGNSQFVAPGHIKKMLLAGRHTLLATKPTYVDDRRQESLAPGAQKVALRLYKRSELTFVRDRWPVWIPYGTAILGALVAGAGGALWLDADNDLGHIDASVTSCDRRGEGNGCIGKDAERIRAAEPDAKSLRLFGRFGLGVGGAVLVTGLALIYANRPREFMLTPEERERRAGITLSLSPTVGPDSAALTARGTF